MVETEIITKYFIANQKLTNLVNEKINFLHRIDPTIKSAEIVLTKNDNSEYIELTIYAGHGIYFTKCSSCPFEKIIDNAIENVISEIQGMESISRITS
ncbi:MAG: hypothetical protein H8E85_02815 [Candidatus Marinimicrobia bacterium]|nr:hypothetical protein [Candidatus Neomarinimicrobiota bacterium]